VDFPRLAIADQTEDEMDWSIDGIVTLLAAEPK
jgi:hypothetical protein